jgi:hypothetical protein
MPISSFFAGFTHVYPAGEKMAARPKRKRAAPVLRLLPGGEDRECSAAIVPIVEAGRETRFQRGKSGNPKGRPSYAILTMAYKDQLERQIDPETAVALKIPLDSTISDGIAAMLTRSALCGDVAAAKEIADRVQGRAPQFIDVNAHAQPKVEYTIKVVEEAPKYPLPPTEQKLIDDLLAVIRTTPDDAIARQVAELTRTLRKKYGAAKP